MYLLLICVMALNLSFKEIHVVSETTTTVTQMTADNQTSDSESQHSGAPNGTVRSTLGFPLGDSGAAMRTFYVVAFAMATVVIYFVVRAVRLRRRKSKSRKYGVITSTSSLEMEPLEKGEDEDDEDTTLFEVHHHNKYGQK